MPAPLESQKSRALFSASKAVASAAVASAASAASAASRKTQAKTPRAVRPRRAAKRRKAEPPPNLFAKALDIVHDEAIEIFRRMLRLRQLGRAEWHGCEAALAGLGSMLAPEDVIHVARAERVEPSDADVIAAARGIARVTHAPELDGSALAGVRYLEGGIGLAPGAALACKLQRKRQIVASIVDERVLASGAFIESLQLALQWELPLLLVAFHAPPDSRAAAQGRTWVSRAESFGFGATRCDGLCALEMRDCIRDAAARVRGHKGPFLLEAAIPEAARLADLGADGARQDPVLLFRQRLIEAGALNEESADGLLDMEPAVSLQV